MAVTLAEATSLRATFKAALEALATGKEYRIGTRWLTRADERWVSSEFARYDALVDALTAGRGAGVRVMRVVPRDL